MLTDVLCLCFGMIISNNVTILKTILKYMLKYKNLIITSLKNSCMQSQF